MTCGIHHVGHLDNPEVEIVYLTHTSMVLIYNSELGVIISSEFFRAKKVWKKRYLLPSIFIYFFT